MLVVVVVVAAVVVAAVSAVDFVGGVGVWIAVMPAIEPLICQAVGLALLAAASVVVVVLAAADVVVVDVAVAVVEVALVLAKDVAASTTMICHPPHGACRCRSWYFAKRTMSERGFVRFQSTPTTQQSGTRTDITLLFTRISFKPPPHHKQ